MQKDEPEVRVEMSFLEIYIENVYDLLAAADAVRLVGWFCVFFCRLSRTLDARPFFC